MEHFVNNIIRPPRAEYDPKEELLDEEFMLKGKWYQRKDLELKNIRGDVLKCSHYMPIVCPEGKPCVIYCHGNSGSRADASEAAIILLPSNITVFTLDFSGSGLSGGEHVTLGWNEKDDLKSVVEYLRQDGNVSSIGLWGRSMGAVTSLLYGAQDPSIAGIVLDSPFSNLVDLMMEVAGTNKIRLPKFTLKFAIQYMRRSVLKKAKFDITELDTIKFARCCFVPLLLGHAVDDDFILPRHSDRIFDAYMGEKNIIKFEGDHNSRRPQFYFDSISIFFNNVLQPPDDDTFDPIPSSPSLISFELSSGGPYCPNVLASIDDNVEYVEYPLDNLTDFTESMEDENKMIMEAVKESLKDFEARPSHAEELSSSNKKTESLEDCDSRESATPIITASKPQVADIDKMPGLSNSVLLAKEQDNGRASAHTDTSLENPSSDSIDLVDHTKVTVTIIRNPSSNIMDGLLSRWDLNFFRNRW